MIGGKDQLLIAFELVDQHTQVASAGHYVLTGVKQVGDLEFAGNRGHELHEALGTRATYCSWVIPGLYFDDCAD